MLDAVIPRQPDNIDVRHLFVVEQLGQSGIANSFAGGGGGERVEEGGVHLHSGVEALFDDVGEVLGGELGDEGGAGGGLDAVGGPEKGGVGLGGVEGVGDCVGGDEGRGVRGVVGGEGDVVWGVPVLGCDFEGEGAGGKGEEGVD